MLRFGLGIALIAAALDQLSKWLMLPAYRDVVGLSEGPVEVTPFFNLVVAWNRGVSFGFLQSGSAAMPWILSALSVAIVAALVLWLRRVRRRLVAGAIGLVIGGALSNVIDRVRFGAVADFLDLHLGSYHWPAFNIADSSIVLGVALLLLDSLLAGRERHK